MIAPYDHPFPALATTKPHHIFPAIGNSFDNYEAAKFLSGEVDRFHRQITPYPRTHEKRRQHGDIGSDGIWGPIADDALPVFWDFSFPI